MTNSTAPALTATTVSVCQTCLLVAAGYSTDEMGYAPTETPWGLWADEAGHPVPEADEEGFSSRPCEGCGDHLAGDRYAATWLA
jgi:hypothetical protein